MPYSEPLVDRTVAVSVSESPDLAPLGMSDSHLRDATAELSRHLLALGARVAYGGDLRAGGFTEILFELVARHRRDADEGDEGTGVLSYLAWPVHLSKPYSDLDRYADTLRGMATILLLDRDGRSMAREERRSIRVREPTREDWTEGLTAMRRRMVADTDARVVAGGRVEGYQGKMPGVAEEALLAFQIGQPLYLLGGFGGCARDIASAIGLIERRGTPARQWEGQETFQTVRMEALANGLSREENETLAHTQHIDEATALVLRGLMRLAGQGRSVHRPALEG
jgi:hypothetical protein